MYIATELLHTSHAEFLALPHTERKKLFLYVLTRAKKNKPPEEKK